MLLTEAVEALVTQQDGVYVDGTFGRGGHSRAVLAQLSPAGRLWAFDKDPEAIAAAAEITDPRFAICHASFADMQSELAARGVDKVAGILLDLGVSSPQIDNPERGFSFRFDAPLDMRMDTTRGETAAEFLARAEVREIAEVIREYGEERFALQIAKAMSLAAKAGLPSAQPLIFPRSWLASSRPANRARILQRAHFKLFGFTSTPSLRRCNKV